MQFFTIGYGGRSPTELIEILGQAGVRAVADIRLRPDRASMGVYQKAKTPEKGIQHLFNTAGIAYFSFPELGNVFLECADWQERYGRLIDVAGELLIARLSDIQHKPWCLLCAEKSVDNCHRKQVAEYLIRTREWTAMHL